MKPYLRLISEGQTLSREQAEAAMHQLMRGEAMPEEIAGFLMGLRSRGETLDELTGFTAVMRAYAVPVDLPDPDAIDLCGTGGDHTGTFNISTAAALVCAGAGVTVAKHGNRSVSSKSGSADVLEALGVQTELRKAGVEYCLREAGIAFLFAPYFHPAMRFVMPVRRALGVRTFFNLLGPMCNPAGVRRQLVGAFGAREAETMAGILDNLGAAHVVAVHAGDGLDEISTTAPTHVWERGTDTEERAYTVTPEQFGRDRVALDALVGGDARENAEIVRGILQDTPGPTSDIVLLNAAHALRASGRFADLDACFAAAEDALASGAAERALARLVEASHAAPTE